MGDKSPKSKQREKNQKDAVKTQSKSDSAKKQAAFAPNPVKDAKKK